MYNSFVLTHVFIMPKEGSSRAPCPALNSLANHGYIPRSGTNISFWELTQAIKNVYNLSYPLAFLLTSVGFLTCGKLHFRPSLPNEEPSKSQSQSLIPKIFSCSLPTWTLDLSSLSARGPTKIAHDASLVHPNFKPSHSPDPTLVSQLLHFAHASPSHAGVSLDDLGKLHAKREASAHHPLDWLHEQIALGECGLAWCVMREQKRGEVSRDRIIPLSTLKQWFGQERLPDGWWDGVRPSREVGLLEAGKCAKVVGRWLTVS